MKLSALHRQWILWRYILRAHVGPFLFSFFTLMFLFLLQFIMKFVDQLVGKGLSGWVIMELIALNLAWMVVLAVPMSVLVATLMAFGDMSSRNEITAMKAAGMSLYRMLAPVAGAGLLICLGLIYFNNSILPDANHRLKNLANDIRRKRPTLTLVNGVFSQDIPGYSILVRRADPKTNDLDAVTIYDYTNPTSNVVITAKSGTISFSPDYRKLLMDLKDGEIHELDLQKMTAYRRVRFEKHRIAMDVQGFDFERTNDAMGAQRGDRELSAGAMQVVVDSLARVKSSLEREFAGAMRRDVELRAAGMLDSVVSVRPGVNVPGFIPVTSPMLALRQTQAAVTMYTFRLENLERQMDQYLVEINKKYSIPVACLVFVLVGVPLGIMARRGGFGVAATLSLGFFILYWACLIGGEKLADRDIVQPFIGMWIANVLIGIVGVYLTMRIGRETILIDWSFLTRLTPRRWRTRLQDEMREDEVEA